MKERSKGRPQEVAAARAGISIRTARKYEQAGQLPSQMVRKEPTHRTRKDPFELDWSWVRSHLERDPALQAKTLFGLLLLDHPGRYQEGQLRTLQRRIETWRAMFGPDRNVVFEQVHVPGRMAQSDFTEMRELGITIAGIEFPHLLYHMVLTYSNHEFAKICFSESFESLAKASSRDCGSLAAPQSTTGLTTSQPRYSALTTTGDGTSPSVTRASCATME